LNSIYECNSLKLGDQIWVQNAGCR